MAVAAVKRFGATVSTTLRLLAIGSLLIGTTVFGDDDAREFDVPAQALSRALEQFSEQTGVSILVTSDLTSDKKSSTVRGHFRPMAALTRLLEGTGLRARRIGPSALTLVPAPAAPAATDTATVPVPSLYAARLQQHFADRVCQRLGDAYGRIRVAVQLWIAADGTVERVHVLDSHDAPRWGDKVRAALAGSRLAPPPPGQPNPVTVLLIPSEAATPCPSSGSR